MLIDLTTVDGLILQIVVAAILLIELLKGIKNGLIVSVLNLAFLCGLIYALITFTPVVTEMVSAQFGTTISDMITAAVGDTPIATFITGLISGSLLQVIVGFVLFLVGMLVLKILEYFVKLMFKKKKALDRLLGAVWGLAFGVVFTSLIIIFLGSPILFTNGETYVTGTSYVNQYNEMVVDKIQEQLVANNLPSTVEDLLVTVIVGNNATAEEKVAYAEVLSRAPQIIGTTDYYGEIVDGGGNVNSTNLEAMITDLYTFSEMSAILDNDTVTDSLKTIVDSYLDSFEYDNGGTPAYYEATVSQAAYDKVIAMGTNLSLDQATLEAIFEVA